MEENNTPEFDLQGFDAQYKTIKDMRKSLKTEIQNLDKEIVNLDENLTILEGEILQAKRNGDDQTRQAKIAERDKTKNDLAKKKVEVEAKKKVLEE